jgi:hypothetical protein
MSSDNNEKQKKRRGPRFEDQINQNRRIWRASASASEQSQRQLMPYVPPAAARAPPPSFTPAEYASMPSILNGMQQPPGFYGMQQQPPGFYGMQQQPSIYPGMQQGAPIVISNTTNTYNINANTYNVNAPVSFNQNSTKDDRQHHHISVARSHELSEPTGNATVEYLDEVDEDVGEEQNGGQDVGEEQKQGEDVVEEHNGGQDVGEEQKQGEDVVEEHNQNRGGWACNLCTFQNENNIEICGGCGHTRGTTSATSDAALDADADAAYSATSDAEPRRTTSRSTDATSASHATDATSDIDDEV